MRRAEVAAPAKVNLFLRILHRRDDGFHALETVFQAVSLSDAVEVALVGDGIRLELDGPELGPPEENLAVRAARAYREATGLASGVRIRLTKAIPAGAGLGGGSSDAAAVLRALEALTGRCPSARLHELAASLGSDVPFFLGPSPLAAATGRGERLSPWRPLPGTDLVLVLPPVHVATAEAYRTLARVRASAPGAGPAESGTGPAATPPRLPPRPADWAQVRRWCHNDFQPLVSEAHPAVAQALSALERVDGTTPLLSGSGGACLAFVSGGGGVAARVAREVAGDLGWPVRAVRTLERLPPVSTRGVDGG